MKWFWLGFWAFLSLLVVSAAAQRPDTIDATLQFTGTYLVVASWTLLALFVVGVVTAGSIALWLVLRKSQVNTLRQRDGHFPLQRIRLGDGRVIWFDPNQMVGPALMVDQVTGEVTEPEPAAGWQVQAAIRALVERTRQTQAMYQGDDSRASKWGSQSRGDRMSAAALRLLNQQQTPRVEVLPAPAVESTTLARSVMDLPALVAAGSAESVAFGHDPQTSDLALWQVLETPHLRLHGGTQKGKTSAALTIVAALLVRHWHVVILDPRGFKDWGLAGEYAELVDVRAPVAFVGALETLHAEYGRRDGLLSEYGARNIAELRRSVQPPRVAVIVEEYGAQRVRARAAGTLDAVDHYLSVLSAEAAADGMHLIAIDQRPADYHPFVKANLGGVIIFPLPDGAGRAAGYAQAHRLPNYHFWYEGQVFRSVHAAPAFAATLQNRTVVYPKLLPDLQQNGAFGGVRSEAFVGAFGGVRPEVGVCVDERTNGDERTAAGWYDWALEYVAAHPALLQDPPSGVRDMARAMAVAAGRTEVEFERYLGHASDLARQIREEARLPGGVRFGTDITQELQP